jgi:hypothetical protein
VFDLIVVSEVGYYLDAADLLLDRTVGSLAPGGVLQACHWRHPVAEYPQSGDDVHHSLGDRPELVRVVHHEETDFLLEVFTQGRRPTVAQWEGLVEPTFNSSITCNETTVHAGRPPAQAREPQMTSNTPVPIGPANSAEADDEKASVDSAEADRLASQGEDTSTVEQRDGEEETDSADADYDASMGKEPETD